MPHSRARNRRTERAKLVPDAERLEARWLPSVAHADLLSPPAAEVANATAVLESKAGQDFQKLSTDLQRVEQASGVRPGQFALLEYDATTIDLAIASSGVSKKQSSQQLDGLQNVLDQSFLAASFKGSGWSELESKVSADLYGVSVNYVFTQSQVAATSPHGAISNIFVQDTFDQMKTIAREAHVTAAEHALIQADEQAIIRDLGPALDMNLGGVAPRPADGLPRWPGPQLRPQALRQRSDRQSSRSCDVDLTDAAIGALREAPGPTRDWTREPESPRPARGPRRDLPGRGTWPRAEHR